MRHPIICLDGPDGVGKSTQAKLLAERLGCILFRQPYASPIYESHIKPILAGQGEYDPYYLQTLMTVARHDGMAKAARHAEVGPVILDRGHPSGWAYAIAEEMDLTFVNILTGHEPKADVNVIVLGVNLERQAERIGDTHRYDTRLGWFAKISDIFDTFLRIYSVDNFVLPVYNVTPAGELKSAEELHHEILTRLSHLDYAGRDLYDLEVGAAQPSRTA